MEAARVILNSVQINSIPVYRTAKQIETNCDFFFFCFHHIFANCCTPTCINPFLFRQLDTNIHSYHRSFSCQINSSQIRLNSLISIQLQSNLIYKFHSCKEVMTRMFQGADRFSPDFPMLFS